MTRTSILLKNKKTKIGIPSQSRVKSFKDYFSSRGFELKEKKYDYIFISMPPFRNLHLFFNQKYKIILDIRDGWSIAQATGYGNTVKSKPFKAIITKLIERFIIKRSYITITCTNGLQDYLQKISGRKILLIPNGVLDEDYQLAKKLTLSISKKNTDELVFCCAGKFSEYGEEKVKKLCDVIIKRYQDKKLKLQLIGSDKDKNQWIDDYLRKASNGRATLEILPRMSRDELYHTMAQANYGLTILRDPSYDYGTKIYDYIALGLPVINYFDEPNNFTKYFDACLDKPFNKNTKIPEIQRSKLISKALDSKDF